MVLSAGWFISDQSWEPACMFLVALVVLVFNEIKQTASNNGKHNSKNHDIVSSGLLFNERFKVLEDRVSKKHFCYIYTLPQRSSGHGAV
jgi:hypothetical protein